MSLSPYSAAHEFYPSEIPSSPAVALVCMPWGSIQKPSLAMAILKHCIRDAGFAPELHFLNIPFGHGLGLDLYEAFAEIPCAPEWFFSHALFGPAGLRELENDWSSLQRDPAACDLTAELKNLARGSEELCQHIATEYVPRFIDQCCDAVDWGKYMAVGFTTTFAQSLASLLLSRRIKEKWPHVQIVFGGANVDSEMGVELLQGFEWIDFVVHGEAEESFPRLLRAIAGLDPMDATLAGVSRRAGGRVFRGDDHAAGLVDLNRSPMPDYDDYIRQLERYGLHRRFNPRLFFESSRGCWWGAKHHCTFCGLNGTTMAFRKKDPERVYEEIVELSRRHRCLKLAATDNILAIDYFSKLLPKLAALDTDVQFFYEVKANMTKEQIRGLRSAGVTEIQPGIESLNSRLLTLMRKGVTAIQNIQLLKWCYEFEIKPSWNILFGFPGEQRADYEDCAATCRLLSHLQPPNVLAPVMFERFSPYFFDKDKYGLNLVPASAYQFIFPQNRVQLDKVAYFFEGDWSPRKERPDEYIGPVREAIAVWKKQWTAQRVYCYYEKGPNYIVIHDNRPRTPSAPLEGRQVSLDEKTSAIYLFCDENRSYQAICEMALGRFAEELSCEKVRESLEQLVFQGLMYREGERYLSLAVRRKPHHEGPSLPRLT